MRAFALVSLQVAGCVVAIREGGQEKLTQELILAASPFVKANSRWQPSSLARHLILSSSRTTWKRGDSDGRSEQQGRGGRSLYSPYSPGPEALRCDNILTKLPTKDFFLSTESNSGLYLCLRFVRFPFLIISRSDPAQMALLPTDSKSPLP